MMVLGLKLVFMNYILNNYSSIKAMLELKIGSSMESHISHPMYEILNELAH